MLEHLLCAAFSAAKSSVEREENRRIDKTEHIINHKRSGVIADELRPVIGHQIGKEPEKTDRCVISDDLDGLHRAFAQARQKPCNRRFRAARPLHRKAEDHRRHNQRQHRLAAPQRRKIRNGEKIDDHFSEGYRCRFCLRRVITACHQRHKAANRVHHHRCDGCCDQKSRHRHAHDLARAAHALHVGDGRRNRAEHHRHHDAEHQVDKDCSDRLQAGCARPDRTHRAARHDGCQHSQDKPIPFYKSLHAPRPLCSVFDPLTVYH